MSVSRIIRTPYKAGVDAHVRDGVVSLQNIVGTQQSEVVFLSRHEIIELRQWFDEILENDHVWEVDGMTSSTKIRWPE
jgi:hypothetical protein